MKSRRSSAHEADDLERRRLTVLYDTMRRLAAVQESRQILDLIVNSATTLLSVEGAGLRLRDGDELVVSARTESVATIMARPRIAVSESLSGAVVMSGEPIVVADLAVDTRHDPRHKQAVIEGGFHGFLGVPLRTDERIIGVLNVFTKQRRLFSADEIALLSSFADQASLAIERDRLFRDAREQATRAQALARLNQVVSSSLDVGHVLHAIARAAAELMAAPLVSFWVADEARRHLDLRALSDDRLEADYPVRSLPFDYSIAGWVATHERALDVPDVSSDLIVAGKDWFQSHGFTSAYGTPIMSQNNLLGVIVLFGSKPFRVTDTDRELLDAFVTQAAVAIRNARLYDEARIAEDRLARRSTQLDLLNQMGGLLQACVSENEAYAVVEQFLSQFFPEASGGVFVTSASRNTVEARATFGPMPSPEATVFKPDECWALRRGRMHVVDTTMKGLQCSHVPHPPPGSYVCLPLIAQGDSLGVLYIGAGIGHAWSESQQRLATTVADHVGLAVANLKLRETLRRQSIRDPLTGLFNRRYLEETIERELLRAERSGGTLGVIMLDLDHFKRFNDSFGHDVADTVLREFSALLQSSVRASDIVCRYGGEEFLLVMPDTSAEITFELAHQLRAAVKQLTVSHRGQVVGSVTVSGGVAVFPTHGATAEALIHSADAALYRAKAQGRDQITMSV